MKINFANVKSVVFDVICVLGFILALLSAYWTANGFPRIHRLRSMERAAARRCRRDSGVKLRRADRLRDWELLEIFAKGRPPDAVQAMLSKMNKPECYKEHLFMAWKVRSETRQEDSLAAAVWQRPFCPLSLRAYLCIINPYHKLEEVLL